MNNNAAAATGQQFQISRLLNAPRELVYRAWTDAAALEKWWGPKGLGLQVLKLEVRPGGIFHYGMIPPQGVPMYGRFRYLEVTAPERLVYVSSFADAEGNVVRAPFAKDFPLELENVLTLTEEDGKTRLHLTGGPVDATPEERAFYEGMFASMEQGFGGTFQQLEAYLEEVQSQA